MFVASYIDDTWYYDTPNGLYEMPNGFDEKLVVLARFEHSPDTNAIDEDSWDWFVRVEKTNIASLLERALALEDELNNVIAKTGVSNIDESLTLYSMIQQNAENIELTAGQITTLGANPYLIGELLLNDPDNGKISLTGLSSGDVQIDIPKIILPNIDTYIPESDTNLISSNKLNGTWYNDALYVAVSKSNLSIDNGSSFSRLAIITQNNGIWYYDNGTNLVEFPDSLSIDDFYIIASFKHQPDSFEINETTLEYIAVTGVLDYQSSASILDLKADEASLSVFENRVSTLEGITFIGTHSLTTGTINYSPVGSLSYPYLSKDYVYYELPTTTSVVYNSDYTSGTVNLIYSSEKQGLYAYVEDYIYDGNWQPYTLKAEDVTVANFEIDESNTITNFIWTIKTTIIPPRKLNQFITNEDKWLKAIYKSTYTTDLNQLLNVEANTVSFIDTASTFSSGYSDSDHTLLMSTQLYTPTPETLVLPANSYINGEDTDTTKSGWNWIAILANSTSGSEASISIGTALDEFRINCSAVPTHNTSGIHLSPDAISMYVRAIDEAGNPLPSSSITMTGEKIVMDSDTVEIRDGTLLITAINDDSTPSTRIDASSIVTENINALGTVTTGILQNGSTPTTKLNLDTGKLEIFADPNNSEGDRIEIGKELSNPDGGTFNGFKSIGGIYMLVDTDGNKVMWMDSTGLNIRDGEIAWDALSNDAKGYDFILHTSTTPDVINNNGTRTPEQIIVEPQLYYSDGTPVSNTIVTYTWEKVRASETIYEITDNQITIDTTMQNAPATYKCTATKDSINIVKYVNISYTETNADSKVCRIISQSDYVFVHEETTITPETITLECYSTGDTYEWYVNYDGSTVQTSTEKTIVVDGSLLVGGTDAYATVECTSDGITDSMRIYNITAGDDIVYCVIPNDNIIIPRDDSGMFVDTKNAFSSLKGYIGEIPNAISNISVTKSHADIQYTISPEKDRIKITSVPNSVPDDSYIDLDITIGTTTITRRINLHKIPMGSSILNLNASTKKVRFEYERNSGTYSFSPDPSATSIDFWIEHNGYVYKQSGIDFVIDHELLTSRTVTSEPDGVATYTFNQSEIETLIESIGVTRHLTLTVQFGDLMLSLVIAVELYDKDLGWIGNWNNMTEIQGDYILTPKLFAGHKDTGDNLSGVKIDQEGIKGYKDNIEVFKILHDGNSSVAEIGGFEINSSQLITTEYNDADPSLATERYDLYLSKTNQQLRTEKYARETPEDSWVLLDKVYIGFDELNNPYANFGDKLVYENGDIKFSEGSIKWEDLDNLTQNAISGYTAQIDPQSPFVYHNNETDTNTPSSINFTPKLIRNADDADVTEDCTFAWYADDTLQSTSQGYTHNTSYITSPVTIKCEMTYTNGKTYTAYGSIGYSSQGTLSTYYWITTDKNVVTYNPDEDTYDGADSTNITINGYSRTGSGDAQTESFYWSTDKTNWSASASNSHTITVNSQDSVTVYASLSQSSGDIVDSTTISVLSSSSNKYSIILSNQTASVPANEAGYMNIDSISTSVDVYRGADKLNDEMVTIDIPAGVTAEYDSVALSEGSNDVDPGNTLTVTELDPNMSSFSIEFTLKNDININTFMHINKLREGYSAPSMSLFSTNGLVFKFDQDNNSIGIPSTNIACDIQNINDPGYTWTYSVDGGSTFSGSLTGVSGTGDSRTISDSVFSSNDTDEVIIKCEVSGTKNNGNAITLNDSMTVVATYNGSDAYNIILSNEHVNIPLKKDGSLETNALNDAYTYIHLYRGTQEISKSEYYLSVDSVSGVSAVVDSTETNKVYIDSYDTSISSTTVTIHVYNDAGMTEEIGAKQFTLATVVPGVDAVYYYGEADNPVISYNPNNDTYSTDTVNLTGYRIVGDGDPEEASVDWEDSGGNPITLPLTPGTDITSTETFNMYIGTTILDRVTVTILNESENKHQMVLSNPYTIVPSTSSGIVSDWSTTQTTINRYEGDTLDNSGNTFTVSIPSGKGIVLEKYDGSWTSITDGSSVNYGNDLRISGCDNSVDSFTITLTDSQDDTISKTYSISKAKQGVNAVYYYGIADPQVIEYEPDTGDYSTSSVVMTGYKVNGDTVSEITPTWKIGSTTYSSPINVGSGQPIDSNTVVDMYVDGVKVDSITVSVLNSASNTSSIILSNSNVSVPADHLGNIQSYDPLYTKVDRYYGSTLDNTNNVFRATFSNMTVVYDHDGTTGNSVISNSTDIPYGATVRITNYSGSNDTFSVVFEDQTNTDLTGIMNISKTKQGDPGVDGEDAYTVLLDNESHSVLCDYQETPISGELGSEGKAKTNIIAYKGINILTPVASGPSTGQFSVDTVTGDGCTAVKKDADTVYIDSFDTGINSASVVFTINLEGLYSVDKTFSITKSIAGQPGEDSEAVYLDAEHQAIKYSPDGSLSTPTSSFNLTATPKNHTPDNYLWERKTNDGTFSTVTGTTSTLSVDPNNFTVGNVYTYRVSSRDSSNIVIATDTVTIYTVQDGQIGEDAIYAKCSASSYYVDYDGTSYTPSSITFTPSLMEGTTEITTGVSWEIYYPDTLNQIVSTTLMTISLDGVGWSAPKTDVVFTVKGTYETVVYETRVIVTIESSEFDWLDEWRGSTTINGTSIATGKLFAGIPGTSTLTGVYLDENGIAGLKEADKSIDPFHEDNEYERIFEINTNGTAKIAGLYFDEQSMFTEGMSDPDAANAYGMHIGKIWHDYGIKIGVNDAVFGGFKRGIRLTEGSILIQTEDEIKIGTEIGEDGFECGIEMGPTASIKLGATNFMDTGFYLGSKTYTFLHPDMTSNTTPAPYVVSSYNSYSDNYKVFNRNETASFWFDTDGQWIQIKLNYPKKATSFIVRKFTIFTEAENWDAWILSGSNDGYNWDMLDQEEFQKYPQDHRYEIKISNPGTYQYYRYEHDTDNLMQIADLFLINVDNTWRMSLVGSGDSYMAWDGDNFEVQGTLIIGDSTVNSVQFKNSDYRIQDFGVSGSYSHAGYICPNGYHANTVYVDHVNEVTRLSAESPNSSDNKIEMIVDSDRSKLYFRNSALGYLSFEPVTSGSLDGYFDFDNPIKVSNSLSAASDLPNGSLALKDTYLWYKDSNGNWRYIEGTVGIP